MVAGQWLTIHDVAELLQVRIETVRRWVRRGDLPVLELGGARSVYRIRPDDLDRFVWQRFLSLGSSPSDEPLPWSPGAANEEDDDGRDSLETPHGTAERTSQVVHDEQLPLLVDRIPAVTFREDASQPGFILYISREIEELLGYPLSDWRQQPRFWLDYVHPLDRERVEAEFARTDATGDPFAMEYRLIARDQSIVWIHCEATLTSHGSEGSAAWEGVLVDISERKRIKESLGLRERQQRAVVELGQHALAGRDLTTLLQEAVDYVSCSLDVEYSKIFEVLPGGDNFVLRAGVGWREHHIGEIRIPAGDRGSNTVVPSGSDYQAGYTLVSREAVISEDLSVEDRFDGQRMVDAYGVRSGASVIIPGRGRPFGVLGAHSTRRRSFNRDDVVFLQSVANVLASVVARSDTHWLTVTDVAESLQVTEETVRRWIRRSELPALNLGGPRAGYRVYPSDLERFITDRLIRL